MDRTRGIGGSDAGALMSGEWLGLWEIKTGRREPEDLSDVLPVQIGIITEEFNRRWFERHTDLIVERAGCSNLVHPEYGFLVGNIDGWVLDGVIECKHVSAFAKDDDIIGRYYPQLQHYLCITQSPRGFLSVIFGNHRWTFFEVRADPDFQGRLVEQAQAFWWHVENDFPPERPETPVPRITLDNMRTVTMTGHNEWASLAADWLETRSAATKFNKATKELKGLIEVDVKKAIGHGVKVTRARNGALSVREAA